MHTRPKAVFNGATEGLPAPALVSVDDWSAWAYMQLSFSKDAAWPSAGCGFGLVLVQRQVKCNLPRPSLTLSYSLPPHITNIITTHRIIVCLCSCSAGI